MEQIINGRRHVFFKIKFNHYRDVSRSTLHEVTDKEEMHECEAVLCLPEGYSDTGDETPLVICCHGAGSVVREEDQKVGGVKYIDNCIDNCINFVNTNTFGCSRFAYSSLIRKRKQEGLFGISNQTL